MKSFKKIREEDKRDIEILNKEVTNFDELNTKLKVMQEFANRTTMMIWISTLLFIVTCCTCCTLMKNVKELKDWKAQVEEASNVITTSSEINE